MSIAVVVSILFMSIALRKPMLVPGRMQAFAEGLYEFIASMVKDNIGSKGREYFPLIFTIFIVVLLGNMLGMIPFSFTYTSHIAVTMGLALAIFLFVTVLGFIKHGFHFFSLFCPAGVPWALKPLIIPIEVLSYMIRPVTLSVRLFANMMAGHLMLKVFAGFSIAMGLGLGFLPMFFNAALIGFEFLIAFLQAYVFTILSCIYLKDAIDLH
jgi:F-type H+-transporting ATPase subunit a